MANTEKIGYGDDVNAQEFTIKSVLSLGILKLNDYIFKLNITCSLLSFHEIDVIFNSEK
jgi:hypothetical protein